MAIFRIDLINYFLFTSDFCPIPALMEYIKSNYDFWKSKCPDSPSYSEEESDTVSQQSPNMPILILLNCGDQPIYL